MSHPESILIPFCWSFIAVLLAMIVVPYFRGKSDLLTAWNLFLLGSINYVGFGGLMSAYNPEHFQFVDFTRRDYELYVWGALAFFIPLALAYHLIKLPRKLAGRTLRKWPPATSAVLFFMLGTSFALAFAGAFPPPIVGVAQALSQIGNKAIVLAVALAFAAWYRDRTNAFLLVVMVLALLLGMVLAIKAGGGRRTVLGVVSALPICMYWFWLRYKSITFSTIVLGVCGVLAFAFIAGYSQVRHFDRRGEMEERSLGNSFRALTQVASNIGSSDMESVIGQNAGQTALTAIHLYTGEVEPEPFHSVFHVATIAIPRELWDDKPKGLGYTLPKTARVRGTRATWGPNVIGHGFHEGGLHMLVFYALVAGIGLRYMDELLVRESRNAYVLAAFAAMSGNIFGWTRGDIGTFTVQIIGAFIALLIVGWTGRLLFGSGITYPRTDGPEYVKQNLFALRWRQAEQAAPTDFVVRRSD